MYLESLLNTLPNKSMEKDFLKRGRFKTPLISDVMPWK